MGESVKLVEDNSLCASEYGFEFKVCTHWYRSLPLSCVEKLAVQLDGENIESQRIRFCVNDKEHELDDLADLVNEFWFVQDSAVVKIQLPGRVQVGQEHTIEVDLILRAPYIKIGPDRFLTMPAHYVSVQTAK
ncbi:MAG: hypothetical protein IPJ46_19155 [Anaerolineales bacterium]|nr:hypothetical protein [Anaerolineales bacterium]